jgi:hypothetical protein
MVERPYKCTLCHASFRNESGMMWHVSHRHEAPQALEALGKTYDEKLAEERREKAIKVQEACDLKTKLDDTTMKLMSTTADLIKQHEENATLTLQLQNMTKDQTRLIYALVARDQVLKQRFGITLPSPFGESDDNPPTSRLT